GLAAGHAESVWMLGAEHRAIGIVVKHGKVAPPERDDLRFGREQHAHRASEALWPALDRPQRRGRPVHRAHPRAHFAAALKKRQCGIGHGPILGHARGYPLIVGTVLVWAKLDKFA